MFLDYVKIFIKAGNGGDGRVSFHREKYVNNGGPDGGDGGKGGDLVFVATASMNTLVDFRYQKHFRAENGCNGDKKNCAGKCGEDLIVRVPCGTVIKDSESGCVICDLLKDGQSKIVLKGGRGGKGNAHFATSTRQSPGFSQQGEKTVERQIILELKVIADVGLIGFPNVGKSTLLSVLTAARPKIANYHFTTLSPNLGVLNLYDDSFVLADIPGLIEGASEGAGLGHYFLRHIERVRLLVHVVDVSGSEGRDPVEDFNKINGELSSYSERLRALPQIVVANKCDLLESKDKISEFEKAIGYKVYPISAVTRDGLEDLLRELHAVCVNLPEPEPVEYEEFEYETEDANGFSIEVLSAGVFEVTGGFIETLSRNVRMDDDGSFRYFQKAVVDRGIIAALKRLGLKDGDTVIMGDIEFEYTD